MSYPNYNLEGKRVVPRYSREGAAKDIKDIYNILVVKHKLKALLIFGTALGAYRDNDFPIMDRDTDIGVFSDIPENVKEQVCNDLLEAGFWYNKIKNWYSFVRYVQNDIDWFTIDKKGNYERDGMNQLLTYDKKWFDKPQEIMFHGDKWLIPDYIEDYLVKHYRNWKVPMAHTGCYNNDFRIMIGEIKQGKKIII